MKDKRMIYICSPLSSPTQEGIKENALLAQKYADEIKNLTGCRTIAPHAVLPIYTPLDDTIPEEREICLNFGLDILSICSAIAICGNKISSGMATEIARAQELGIQILRYDSNLQHLSFYFKNVTEFAQY
jgi:hypothetical protein